MGINTDMVALIRRIHVVYQFAEITRRISCNRVHIMRG